MAFATKKPIEIEYMVWNGNNTPEIDEFMGDDLLKVACDDMLVIRTLEGEIYASIGDYIIKGVKGEFCTCKPDIFKLTYDLEEDLILEENDLTEKYLHNLFKGMDHKEKLLFISNLLNTMQIQEGKSFVLLAETGSQTMHSYSGNMIKMTKIIRNILKSKGF